jgi:hypothetical protein
MLNKAFGYLWEWEAEREWIQESYKYFNQYSKVPEDQKISYNGKKGAWEEQAPVCHVKGRLTVWIETHTGNLEKITKTGYGSKSIIGKQSEQESAFKSAGTDALKKAASLFGIGLALYRDEEEQEYFDEMNYEDPWTDEMLAKYTDEREYLSGIMETYQLGTEDMDSYVQEFSEGVLNDISQITPENIQGFVEYMKNRIAAGQNGTQEAK